MSTDTVTPLFEENIANFSQHAGSCLRAAAKKREQLARWERSRRTPWGWLSYWLGWPMSKRAFKAVRELIEEYEDTAEKHWQVMRDQQRNLREHQAFRRQHEEFKLRWS